MLKLMKAMAGAVGVHSVRKSSVPFGVNPFEDLASLAPALNLAFDVGGNVGQTVNHLRRAFPAARIVSFEPVPATFAALRANTERDLQVHCVQAALGEASGEAQMTADPMSGQNTLNVAAHPGHPRVTVPVVTLDGYCAAERIETLDLLKIDTEGSEAAVLKGASAMLANGRIRFILAECEFTPNPAEPHGDFFEIAGILMPLGYRVVAFYSGGVNGDGWVWGDVLFMLPFGERAVTCSPYDAGAGPPPISRSR